MNIFGTFGVLPLVALLGMRTWPHLLRVWFWLIVPLWIVVHVLASLINETVLFFEPTALLLIPGSIFAAMHVASPERLQRTQREPVSSRTRINRWIPSSSKHRAVDSSLVGAGPDMPAAGLLGAKPGWRVVALSRK